jgi:hypothetical protein
LNDVARKHHVSPIKPVKIDPGYGSNENRGEKNSSYSNPNLEGVACELEDIPYRGYIEDEVTRLGNKLAAPEEREGTIRENPTKTGVRGKSLGQR